MELVRRLGRRHFRVKGMWRNYAIPKDREVEFKRYSEGKRLHWREIQRYSREIVYEIFLDEFQRFEFCILFGFGFVMDKALLPEKPVAQR